MASNLDLTWRLENVRLSLFLSELSLDSSDTWWTQVVGTDPEESITKRATGEHVDQGPFENARIWVSRNTLAKRVDWIMHPNPNVENGFPELGPFQEWQEKFLTLMMPWLAGNEMNVIRIAYGATLLAPVETYKAGYEFLRAALPMIQFEDDWADFLFQVTKQRSIPELDGTSLQGSSLNCLSKWSVAQLILLANDPSVGPSSPIHAGRMELDLNTKADNKAVLQRDKVTDIVQGLASLASRYSKEGFLK